MSNSTLRKQIESIPKGYTAWAIRQGLTLHMNGPYDFVKYSGKSKSINQNTFNSRPEREKIVFSMIEKNCDNDYNTILQFMIFYMTVCDANNYLENPTKKIYLAPGEMIHESVKSRWDAYLSKTYRRSECFKKDVETICNYIDKTSSIRGRLATISSNPNLFFEYILIDTTYSISMIESLIVVDKIGKLSTKVLGDFDHKDTLVADCAARINKLGKLFNIDEEKYEKLIMELVNTESK